jgi:hypothetical protein
MEMGALVSPTLDAMILFVVMMIPEIWTRGDLPQVKVLIKVEWSKLEKTM